MCSIWFVEIYVEHYRFPREHGWFSIWFTMCELGAERILMIPNELGKKTGESGEVEGGFKMRDRKLRRFWIGEISQINWEFQGRSLKSQVFEGGITAVIINNLCVVMGALYFNKF